MKPKNVLYALGALILISGAYFMAQAKGLRNNNPLNIKYSGDKWQGMTGTDGPFVVFETPKHGLRAAGRILRTYAHRHQLRDIEGIVSRWAPPSENDTQNYIEFVTTKTGLPRNQALDRDTYPQVLAAMIHMENGSQPFSLGEIRQGFEWGFYG